MLTLKINICKYSARAKQNGTAKWKNKHIPLNSVSAFRRFLPKILQQSVMEMENVNKPKG